MSALHPHQAPILSPAAAHLPPLCKFGYDIVVYILFVVLYCDHFQNEKKILCPISSVFVGPNIMHF